MENENTFTVKQPLLTKEELNKIYGMGSTTLQQDIYTSLMRDMGRSSKWSRYANYAYGIGVDRKDDPDETPEEEWIWVDGYKATKRDMTCYGYQYELGKQHDMPENKPIIECASGFHMCLKLDDVFRYYSIAQGNRFFKVRALVRKDDAESYGNMRSYGPARNKLVAKSIVFVSELTNDEIFKGTEAENWSADDKADARIIGIQSVKDRANVATLVSLGYSEAFAKYIIDEDEYNAAYAAGTQTDLSMDMKVAYIMRNM